MITDTTKEKNNAAEDSKKAPSLPCPQSDSKDVEIPMENGELYISCETSYTLTNQVSL